MSWAVEESPPPEDLVPEKPKQKANNRPGSAKNNNRKYEADKSWFLGYASLNRWFET